MPKLTDFKALLFDIDRTLSNTSAEITPETVEAINKLSQAGYTLAVCSGRGTPAIKNKILPLFPENSVHIATGGSQLIDSKGNVIWEQPIDTEVIAELKEYISNSNIISVFMKTEALYSLEPTVTNINNHPWNQTAKNLIHMTNDGVGAVYLTNLNPEVLDYVEKNPKLSFKKMTSNSGRKYIDITAKGVNKAETLKKWIEHTKIPAEKIIGFGDSLNDLEFLKLCGHSVAMGNAVNEIKTIADTTIGHTDENALSQYLLTILKGGDL